MKRVQILQNALYGILLIVFLVLYLILSLNNRPAADDFYFLANFNDYGWWQSMLVSWHSWVTRWSSVLFLNGIFLLHKLNGNFLFYHVVTLLMLCFALYRLSCFLTDFIVRSSNNKSVYSSSLSDLPRHSRFAIALLISFFILMPGTGETFFWITSSAMYLWGFIAFCFLIAEILRAKQTFSSVLVCVITAAYIGGSAESIALPTVTILAVFLVYRFMRKDFKPMTAIALAILLISVGISYAGEGRAFRQSALPQHDLLKSFILTVKSVARIDLFFLKEKFTWLILFFISWTGFSAMFSGKLKLTIKTVTIILIGYFVLCFIFIFPSCFLLGEIPPQRAWLLMVFLNCILLSFAGIVTGSFFRNKKMIISVSSLAVVSMVVMMGYLALEQKTITGVYARAVDLRMKLITTFSDNIDSITIILEPLPDSGMLQSSEISSLTSDFRNEHLKKYFGLKSDLRLK